MSDTLQINATVARLATEAFIEADERACGQPEEFLASLRKAFSELDHERAA